MRMYIERKRKRETVKVAERWTAAIANPTETASNLDHLQKLLINKADDGTFAKASLSSEQVRTFKKYLKLQAKQQEIYKRDKQIKLLEAIIQTLDGRR